MMLKIAGVLYVLLECFANTYICDWICEKGSIRAITNI